MPTPFDPLDALDAQHEAAAGTAIYGAVPTAPDRMAKVQKYAAALEVPPETVDRNFATVDAEQQAAAARAELGDTPATREWFGSIYNAQVAHDHVAQLAGIERLIQSAPITLGSVRDRLPIKPGEATVSDIRQPTPTAGSVLGGLGTAFRTGGQMAVAGTKQSIAELLGQKTTADAAARDFAHASNESQDTTPAFQSRTGAAVYGGASSFLQTAPAVLASILSRDPAPALAVMGAQTSGSAYGKYRQRGATPGMAALGAGGEGAIEVATELIPMGFLTDRLGKVGMGEFIAGLVGRELPGEELATLTQDAIDTAIANPNKTWAQYWQERPGAAYDTLVATGMSSLTFGAMHAAMTAGHKIEGQQDHATASTAQAETVQAIAEAVKAAPLTERDPAKMEELLSHTFGDEHVYIPAETIQTYLQDLKPAEQQQFIAATGIGDQLSTELPAGADILIPAGKYFAHIAPTDAHAKFADDLRLGPDAMSVNEAKDFEATKGDLITAEGERLAEEQKHAADSAAPGDQVYADVFSQLRAAGYTIDAARAQALLWQSRYETRAERNPNLYGDALAAYKASNPKVVAQLGAELAPRVDKLDLVADELRRARSGTDQKRGPSLIQFLAKTGGLVDAEGDLAGMDAGNAHKGRPGQRKLINPEGRSLEDAAVSAWEHGYLPGDEAPEPGDLLDAIRGELAGNPAHAVPVDERRSDFARAVEQLDALLARLGVDPAKASNKEIKAAVAAERDRLAPVGGETLEQFAGERAWTAPQEELGRAQEMEAAKELPGVIEDETGWRRGDDGRWRFEISDEKAALKPGGLAHLTELFHKDVDKRGSQFVPLGDLLDHPDLYEAYPLLVDTAVRVERASFKGAFAPDVGIGIGERMMKDAATQADGEAQLYSTLMHEVQHVVQYYEGHAMGASASPAGLRGSGYGDALAEEIDRLREEEFDGDQYMLEREAAYQVYRRSAGEIEARNTQQRLGMTAQERRDLPGDFTRDTPRDQAIVRLRVRSRSLDIPVDEPATYEQPARGSITFGQEGALIRLFAGRDLSTLLHEGGHLWLNELEQDATAEGASDQLKEDWATFRKWAGLEDGAPISVEAHELFARGVEAYMREGRAPSPDLRGVFSRFSAWLVRIYRKADALSVKVSPQMRDVFARLIATDDEIKAATERQGLNPVFAEKPKTATQAEFDAYTRAAQAAQAQAHGKLLNKVMSTLRRERTAEFKAEWQKVREEEASVIDSRRDVRAHAFLTTGLEIGQEGDPDFVRLDRKAVGEILGTDNAHGQLPRGITARGGVDPHIVAARFGYDSAEPMLHDLMTLEAQRKALRENGDTRGVRQFLTDEATDRTMRERHGDPLSDGSLEDEALDAVNGDKRAEFVGQEIRLLAREAGEPDDRWTRAGLKAWAEASINARPVGELRPSVYQRAERQAGIEAQRLLLKGKAADALAAKWKQLANLHLYRAARDAQDKTDKALRSFSRTASTRTLTSTDQEYLDAAHGLLVRFGFKELRLGEADKPDFDKWSEERADDGEYVPEPPLTTDRGEKMSVADILQLKAVVDAILFLGREQQHIFVAGVQVALEQITQEAVAAAQPLKDRALGKPWNPQRDNLRDLDASLLTVETWLDWLDGGDKTGPWNRALIWGASDAHAEANELYKEIADRLRAEYLAVPKAERSSWAKPVDAPELVNPANPGAVMSKAELLAVALNTGNESNLGKLVEGYKWTEGGVQAALDRNMTQADWKYVQGVWDALESLWPRIAATERELVGVEPDRIINRVVRTPFGELAGGYYPVVYDPANDTASRGRKISEEQLLNDIMVRTSTGKVHERGNYTGPILLDVEQVITSEVNKRIQRIAYGQYVLGARRFIMRKEVVQTIRQKLGDEYYDQLLPWLRRQIGARIIDPNGAKGFSKFVRRARMNATVVGMGFRASTVLSQLAGLGSSAAEIGEKWVAIGVGLHAQNPIASTAFAFERSRELSSRLAESSRDVRDALGELANKPGHIPGLDEVRRAALYGIGWTDLNIVAIPTWRGAYEKAKAEGSGDADAIRLADKAVRKSQGAGMSYTISAVQDPSNEMMRLFTMFYSWMNTSYNRQRDAVHAGSRGDFAEAFHKGFWYVAALPVIAALLSGQGPDDGEPWAEWVLRSMALNLTGGVPVLRDAASYATAKITGHGFAHYSVTPLARGVESIVTSAVDVAKLIKGEPSSDQWIKHTIELPGWVFGLPTGQLANTGQYLWNVLDGAEQPADAAEFAKGLMTGKGKSS